MPVAPALRPHRLRMGRPVRRVLATPAAVARLHCPCRERTTALLTDQLAIRNTPRLVVRRNRVRMRRRPRAPVRPLTRTTPRLPAVHPSTIPPERPNGQSPSAPRTPLAIRHCTPARTPAPNATVDFAPRAHSVDTPPAPTTGHRTADPTRRSPARHRQAPADAVCSANRSGARARAPPTSLAAGQHPDVRHHDSLNPVLSLPVAQRGRWGVGIRRDFRNAPGCVHSVTSVRKWTSVWNSSVRASSSAASSSCHATARCSPCEVSCVSSLRSRP
jgi:hypothetical protein